MRVKRALRLTAEFAISMTVLLLAANLFLGMWLTKNSKKTIKTLIAERMLDIANSAADMIDGDVLASIRAEDEGTAVWQKIYDTLKLFQDNIALEYIYCANIDGERQFSYCIDPDPNGNPGVYGQPIECTDALVNASLGIADVDKVPHTDDWGRFYSAYSPVFDSNGRVGGIVVVDFSADWYDAQISKQSHSTMIITTIELFIGLLLVVVSTGNLRKRLRVMTSELSEVTRNIDELTNELDSNGVNKSVEVCAPDDMKALGNRIHNVKERLNQYTTNLHSRAKRMIEALSGNYDGVFFVNLDTDEGICYQPNMRMTTEIFPGKHCSYMESVERFAKNHVVEKYRKDYMDFMHPETIRKRLENENVITFIYQADYDGEEIFETVRIAEVPHSDNDGPSAKEICVGFSTVDDDTLRILIESDALSNALNAAEDANKAKTAFLSNMSHEIRTPMNAIIGLNRIVLKDPDISASTRSNLEKIATSADHLLHMINEILDMSRIESGKMVLKHEAFSLPVLLGQINDIIGSQCKDKGLEWNSNLTGNVGEFYMGDELKIKEILINILGNAVKFTPEGGKVLFTVEGIRHYEDNTVFCFTIEDTGIGMSKEYLPKLFEPFSQEDYSLRSKFGSTGLGMSITKSIVEMMNGEIKVESEKNVGTKFTVILTLEDCKEKSDGNMPVKNVTHIDLTGKRILIAEDVEINADILQMILEERGVKTDVAQNGLIALESFKNSAEGYYDAILMDMRMPEMDGLEATAAIRGLDRNDAKSIPIIALTANAFEEDVQKSLQSGLNAHLSKPVNPDILFETLEQLLVANTTERDYNI